MANLTCRIPKETWMPGLGKTNGYAPSATKAVEAAGPWEASVQRLVQFQHLGDDWDGCGAKSPSRELLTSAIALAYVFRDNGVPPPSRVVPGLDGIVLFEWQFPDGAYGEVEIVRPFFAEVMLVEPGQPAQHWTLPSE